MKTILIRISPDMVFKSPTEFSEYKFILADPYISCRATLSAPEEQGGFMRAGVLGDRSKQDF